MEALSADEFYASHLWVNNLSFNDFFAVLSLTCSSRPLGWCSLWNEGGKVRGGVLLYLRFRCSVAESAFEFGDEQMLQFFQTVNLIQVLANADLHVSELFRHIFDDISASLLFILAGAYLSQVFNAARKRSKNKLNFEDLKATSSQKKDYFSARSTS